MLTTKIGLKIKQIKKDETTNIHLLTSNLGNFPGEIRTWQLYMEGEEKMEREADHSRLAGGCSNKQGTFYTRLVLSGCKMH